MATPLYAQLTGGNINDANQWNTVADGSGSDVPFASIDDTYYLEANNETVVINVGFTCDNIRNANGGGFTYDLTTDTTITCDVVAKSGSSSSAACLTTTHASGTLTIDGDVKGGDGSDTSGERYGLYHNGAGTTTVTGSSVGGGNSNNRGTRNAHATGIVNFGGDSIGGSGNASFGAFNAGTGTTNIAGNSTGGSGSTSVGAYNLYQGTINVTGSSTGGSGDRAVGSRNANSSGKLIVNGNIINTQISSGAEGYVSWQPAARTNYIEYLDGDGGTVKSYAEDYLAAAGDIRNGTTNGPITGTLDVSGGVSSARIFGGL